MVPQSSLGFYLEWLTKEGNLATVVIMNGMTISLVGQNNNIIIIDGQLGAMVGLISIDKRNYLFLLNSNSLLTLIFAPSHFCELFNNYSSSPNGL